MRFYFFHLMPYADLDLEYAKKHRTSHIKLPNGLYDPKKGAELYNRYLDEMEYAAELGFEGVCCNEHHQTAYGLMPQPGVIAGALSRRIRKGTKICVLGRATPLLANPLSVAEEYAMLDNITRGQLVAGFVRGIGTEYHATATNPTESVERFREAMELILQAWTKPGPSVFEGKYYNFPYVNVWPRPYQQPHPEIWLPSTGSSETISYAAESNRRYLYMQTSAPSHVLFKNMQAYRDAAARYGYTANPNQLGWSPQLYVAETDEIAQREAKPHIENFANRFMFITPEMFIPPGYTSAASAKAILKAKSNVTKERTMEEMIASETFICGSPETVIKKLKSLQQQGGFNVVAADMHFGTLPHDLTMKNIRLFAQEVMPAVLQDEPSGELNEVRSAGDQLFVHGRAV